MKNEISWEDFSKIDMRVGTIRTAEVFTAAKKPAYQLTIDFGAYGIKKTSAQITQLYTPAELIGRQIIGVINFPPKQIANIMSECLLLGCVGEQHEVTLIQPDRAIENGLKIS